MSNRNGMIHLNSNLLCAIDIETTGTDPTKHDIIQICVLPLDCEIRPHKDILPFYTEMQPLDPDSIDPEAMDVHKLDLCRIMQQAMDPWRVAELFDEWFQKLKLPFRKKITPLAHNWPFEYGFLTKWLGKKSMEDFFFGYRDTMALANAMNDSADFHVEPCPYPKVSLKYLCSQLKVEHTRAHDALPDCVATAECYRKMLMGMK
jgi:DNA polymerase III epsilon subunit-like protein